MRRSLLLVLVGALGVAICCLVHAATSEPDSIFFDIEPADKLASAEARATLQTLAQFTLDPQAGILSGQNVGIAGDELRPNFRKTWTKLTVQRKCPTPAVMTVDLATKLPRHTSFFIKKMRSHVEQGGLVGMSMHPPNPWTSRDSWDVRNVSFEDLMTNGTRANKRYRRWLRGVADILDELQDSKVTVLWRPLHEANGDWFWWSYGGRNPRLSEVQYQQLWHSLFRYFVEERELHNLLWVYCSNVNTGAEIVPFDVAYPGDEFVDVVGLDYYGPRLAEIRADYRKLGSFGKVMCLAEYGPKPWNRDLNAEAWLGAVKGKFPQFAYFCSWHSWPEAAVALADHEQAPQLLNDPFVVNLEGLAKRRSAPKISDVDNKSQEHDSNATVSGDVVR